MLNKSSMLARIAKSALSRHSTGISQTKTTVKVERICISSITRYNSTETNNAEERLDPDKCEENKSEEIIKRDNTIEKLNENIMELTDKYKRSLAENENIRSRMRREVHDAKLFGIQGFCKDLLQVSDILDKAVTIAHDSLDLKGDDSDPVKNFYDGVRMTEAELLKVFKKHSLEMFEPKLGEKFDPYQHDAIMQVPTADYEPGHIAYIQNHGYKLHDRTIKPATVGVSKAP